MTERDEEYWCLVDYIHKHKTELNNKYGDGFTTYLLKHMNPLDYVGSYDSYFNQMNKKRLH
jgi:hypothetical protein